MDCSAIQGVGGGGGGGGGGGTGRVEGGEVGVEEGEVGVGGEACLKRTSYKQILIYAKFKRRKRGQKTELTGKSP